jgi:uncharacterized protein YndB with AHSA1/START domain/uncharacterized protein YciI
MKRVFSICIYGFVLASTTLAPASVLAQNAHDNTAETGGATMMNTPNFYFVRLIGTRDGWPNDMTPEEERIMEEHYHYLVDLVKRDKCMAAGPVFDDPVFGLIILRVDSEEEARKLMDSEPSVVGGVHTYELSDMKLSLMADYMSSTRHAAEPSDRILKKYIIVPASIDEVWKRWTTTEGVNQFFSQNARVELRIGGPFEIYFDMSAPYGLRGSENCRILSFMPQKMLSFEWNAPPKFDDLRYQYTRIVLEFSDIDSNQTRVDFTQLGWGKGEEWDAVYDYFDSAWDYVLDNLKKSFE